MTGEHPVSKNLFSKKVKAKRLPWCQESFKEVGINSLVANILCKKHNEDLSPIDEEIKRFGDCIVEWYQSDPKRGARSKKIARINGVLLIRWFAKTFCNLLTSAKRDPLPLLARIAFELEGNNRVYVGIPETWSKPRIDPEQPLRFADFHNANSIVVYYGFFGIPWLLANHQWNDLLYLPSEQIGPIEWNQVVWGDGSPIKFEYDSIVCDVVWNENEDSKN